MAITYKITQRVNYDKKIEKLDSGMRMQGN